MKASNHLPAMGAKARDSQFSVPTMFVGGIPYHYVAHALVGTFSR